MFLEAFLSLSCSVPQLTQSTERIDKSILPHLKPQSAQTKASRFPPANYLKLSAKLFRFGFTESPKLPPSLLTNRP